MAISITDTGVGMDEETLSHLFEPFFTTKGPGRGTGLGLATAYGIIRQSGGAIAIASEAGKGTTRAHLPSRWRSQAGSARTRRRPPRPAATGVETILLVEDEARVRKLIADVLASRGYTRTRGRARRGSLAALPARTRARSTWRWWTW